MALQQQKIDPVEVLLIAFNIIVFTGSFIYMSNSAIQSEAKGASPAAFEQQTAVQLGISLFACIVLGISLAYGIGRHLRRQGKPDWLLALVIGGVVGAVAYMLLAFNITAYSSLS